VMENLKKTYARIDAFEDPFTKARKKLKDSILRIVRHELDGLSNKEIIDKLLDGRLDALAEHAEDVFESGRYGELDQLLGEFASGLRAARLYEQQHGALKVVSPESELERCAGTLGQRKWNPCEQQRIRMQIKDGEQIISINLREIKTTQRTIVRRDPDWNRFREVGNSQAWFYDQGTPESVICEAEQRERKEAEELERPFSSGPMGRPAGSEPR
jgi:hypothetical protein